MFIQSKQLDVQERATLLLHNMKGHIPLPMSKNTKAIIKDYLIDTCDVFFLDTRSYAALRAADLDWIVGPGYSLGQVHSGEKP